MMKQTHCTEYAAVSRRDFLGSGLRTVGGLLMGNRLLALPSRLPRLHLADPHIGPPGDTLVCIFLRGGADGLNIVVPHGDADYYDLRPTIGIPRPDAGSGAKTADLDGFFGLHPALEPLHAIYEAGDVAFVHAAGSPDETRSHFEAMDLMERGATARAYSGWLARHLASLDTGNESALRAIGVGDMLPTSLNGAVSATALESIAAYHLQVGEERVGSILGVLQALYQEDGGMLTAVAEQTMAAMAVLEKVDAAGYAARGRPYPEQDLGQGLRMVAQLIRADVGVEVACLDMGGWDTHVGQGGTEGLLARLLTQLAEGLAAFYEDLADRMNGVTVVVMSEFGRRARENGGLGTDHGHGNVMMVMGGGVNGRTVYGRWPGLAPAQLVGPGDLAITTDYRDVLGEILHKRLNNPRLAEVFPGYKVGELGLAVPR